MASWNMFILHQNSSQGKMPALCSPTFSQQSERGWRQGHDLKLFSHEVNTQDVSCMSSAVQPWWVTASHPILLNTCCLKDKKRDKIAFWERNWGIEGNWKISRHGSRSPHIMWRVASNRYTRFPNSLFPTLDFKGDRIAFDITSMFNRNEDKELFKHIHNQPEFGGEQIFLWIAAEGWVCNLVVENSPNTHEALHWISSPEGKKQLLSV